MKKLCVLLCAFLVSCTSNPVDNTTEDLTESIAPFDNVNTKSEITPTPLPALLPSQTPIPTPQLSPTPSPSPSPTPSPTPSPVPEPEARLSDYEPYQGQTIGFELQWPVQDAAYTLRATHLEEDIIPFEINGKLAALIPVTPSADTGQHGLDVIEILNGVENTLFHIEYTIKEVEYSRQDLTMTGETAAIYTNENIRSDNEKVYAAKSETIPNPLWEGAFIQPVDGRITTDFGQARYTNGEYTSRHSAFDIAAPEGTGVAAAANGRVVFAGPLIVSGNAVIIDHGMWLYTSYYHLSAVDVTAGDEVSAGDIIGKVGSTGYSTGPHLHYAATVKLSPVNPDMLKSENPLDFNS